MHHPAARARRLAEAAVALCDVTPARPTPLEREHLRAALAGASCDLTLTGLRAWARARRLDPDGACAWALELDAICDCELARKLT